MTYGSLLPTYSSKKAGGFITYIFLYCNNGEVEFGPRFPVERQNNIDSLFIATI